MFAFDSVVSGLQIRVMRIRWRSDWDPLLVHQLRQAEKALNAKIGFAVSPSQVKNCLLGSFRECVLLLISRTRDTARRHVVHRNKMSLQILHAYQTAAAAGV